MASSQSLSVATNPVGITRIEVPTNSDTFFAIGFHRSVLFRTTVASVQGNVVTLNGSPGWSNDELKYAPGIQPNDYVLLFGHVDRPLSEEGKYFLIESNTSSTVTLDLTMRGTGEIDPLANLQTGAAEGDPVLIIPCWTIDSLFAGIRDEGIKVTIFDDSQAGANQAVPYTFCYDSSEHIWKSENGMDGDFGNSPIFPGQSVCIRNETGEDKTMIAYGSVPMESFRTVVYTAANDQPQDIYIGIRSPMPILLEDAVGLGENGDELLIFDNTQAIVDKSASRILEYIDNGRVSVPGWYDGVRYVGDSEELLPGVGYVLRKAPSSNPTSSYWQATPSYLSSLLSN